MATTSLRTSVMICGGFFVAMIALAIVGNVLEKSGVTLAGGWRYVVIAVFFTLFLGFGFSAIPVMAKLVLGAQVRLGNQDVAAVAAALRQQNLIIWAIWGLMIAGTLIAIPAAIFNGALGDGPTRALSRVFAGPKLGTLTARPGMTVADMLAQSTMKIDVIPNGPTISGRGVFDLRVAGTGITLENARYYFISTVARDPSRIRIVNVGTSAEKAPVAEIDAQDAALARRLAADGWLAGHEVYRTEEDQTLHGGKTEGPEGTLWLKDHMILSIARNRMDDAQPGEDDKTAGQWIQYVELWPQQEFPYVDRYVFQPAKGGGR
jgi:hypothetical protein